ncbi:hypothetical protein LOTGIDRAFT_239733 [Lottia gigantea]|uniref:THAP-type domain-containing protein n=1 Tax=Lottia gigantea TaxID=225164 RepID=V4B3C9_LOTGI|nr:hypothetical protein LOTGIDRAFT_239733 [Lottia gigantea]ESP00827.1 hypothetical protein LOTGIDRAFT_239733 [Lottia gigantea]
MPVRNAVAGCSNTNKDGVPVNKFPKENMLRAHWTRFVNLSRADFTQSTRHQTICEDHFASECYDQKYKIKQALGFTEKCKKLLPGSVPSIYPKIVSMMRDEEDQSNSNVSDFENSSLGDHATTSFQDISENKVSTTAGFVKNKNRRECATTIMFYLFPSTKRGSCEDENFTIY